MDKLFAGSKHAALYSLYRFRPPHSILVRILGYLQEKVKSPLKLAIDVACGSGQSTEFLAPKFNKVLGFDVSESQIVEAKKDNQIPSIEYKVGSSTSIACDNASADLISASQSFHWFELPAFYEEAKRVLVPDGVLCMYWYTMPEPIYGDRSDALQKVTHRMYSVDTKAYWHENRKLVDRGFDGLDFPFRDVVRETFFSNFDVTLADYVGYVKTWSAYQLMKKAEPERAKKFISDSESEMMEIIGSGLPVEEIKLSLRFKYFLIMGRK